LALSKGTIMANDNNDNKLDLRNRLAQWLEGRNGTDELAMACVWLAIVLYILSLILHSAIPTWIALVLLVYAALRMSSRSIAARRRENRLFLSKVGPLGSWLRNPVEAATEAKSYKHLTCPSCGQKLRVPRGRGKMRVTCPKCHESFDAQS
jgi:hypothetical protein